jgi:hypothetical protein
MEFGKIISGQSLERILIKFIDVLRINLLIVDSKGYPVLAPKTWSFGYLGSSQWGTLQKLGTPEFLSQFQIDGNYLRSIDKFGLQSFAIPIPNGKVDDIGYLIVGPVILNKQFEQGYYQSIANEAGVSFSDLQECLNEVRVVTFNGLKSILDLLFDISRYSLRINKPEKSQVLPAVNKDQPAHSIFSNLLDLAMAITQAECGSIMLLNNITNELSILTSKGVDQKKFQDIPMKLSDGVAGLAVQKREPFLINETQSNNRISHLLKKPELKCALVLPIIKSNNEVLGVLNISTHQGTSRLAMQSREMLNSLVEITSETFSNFI